MGGEEESEHQVPLDSSAVDPEYLTDYRIAAEKEWYLSEEGYLDFVRDCGAAPDAQQQPHGRLAPGILKWNGEPDEESGQIIYKYKMQLWPRGSFKSQVFDVGYVCWRIAKNPDIRILVASETGKQAREFVENAKLIIESPWFEERFGSHKGKHWKQGSFKSIQRGAGTGKEPTLQATGVGEVRTGMHWDLALLDDVCSQENTKNSEAIEALYHWFGETLAQLDPGCQLLMIGTLHHYADIYCRIQKDPEMRKLFEFSIYAWKNDGELFFPGRLTEKYIAQQKALLPPRLFACFYMNQPTTDEEKIFRPSYFRVIPEEDIPPHVWTYLLTDFAFIAEEKKKGKADRTAFWVVSLDCHGVAYVRDFYVGRWKPSDSVRIVCDLWNRYQRINIKAVVIEDTTHKELLSSLFEEVRRQTFVRPKIITITGRNQETKDMRIEGIEPRFRRGDIYFSQNVRSNYRKWKPMIDEMTEWPFSQHDDIPDSISDIDKTDKDGRRCLPLPGPGWRASIAIQRQEPSLIDGQLNPRVNYDAREMGKAQQQGDTLWQRQKEGMDGGQQRLFRRPPQSPTRLK